MGTCRKKHLDETDIRILNWLVRGQRFTVEDTKECAKASGITPKDVQKRISLLKQKNILLQERSAIVNPLGVWDHYFITLIKAKIPPPIVGREIQYPLTWVEMVKRIRETQKKLRLNVVRGLYSLMGTEYDILLITTMNDHSDLQEFLEVLTKQGWIDRAWTIQPGERDEAYIFDPIAVPTSGEYKKYVKNPISSFWKMGRGHKR